MVVKAESCVKSDDGRGNDGAKPAPPSGADNVKGPWHCAPCGTGGEPLVLLTYYNYLKHLQVRIASIFLCGL